MCTWTRMLDRLLRLVGAYLGASLAAGFVIVLAIMLIALAGLIVSGSWTGGSQAIPTLLIGWGIASFYVAVLALVPALLVVALAEGFRARSASFYGWAGVATAGLSATMFAATSWNPSSLPANLVILAAITVVLALAGLVGGLVFRRIAVRDAGEGCGQ